MSYRPSRKILTGLLTVTMLLAMLLPLTLSTPVGAYPLSGVFRGSAERGYTLNVRPTASTAEDSIGSFNKDSVLTILAEVKGQNISGYGDVWYEISYASGPDGKAYVIKSPDIELIDPMSDTYEDKLRAAGFPESYIPGLMELHYLYPDWSFLPIQVPYDWSYVMDRQAGVNSVWYSHPVSQRSQSTVLENGYGPSYNQMNDTYTPRDGSSFYYASKQTIGHYMDPRNFLTPQHIFMFESLCYDPSQTEAGVEAILAGTFMSKDRAPNVVYTNTEGQQVTINKTYAQIILEAAQYSGASAYFLASRMRLELGVNGSLSVSGTFVFDAPDGSQIDYTGYYNYFNIKASDATYPNQNIANGLEYAKNGEESNDTLRALYQLPWDSPEKAINGGAKFISRTFLDNGQDSLYLQKFNVNPTDPSRFCRWQYMTSVHAPNVESNSVFNSYNTIGSLDNPYTFRIPVYRKMPADPVQLATETRSTNNLLTSLSLNIGDYLPGFSYDKTGPYELLVNEDVTSVKITARKASPKASVLIGSTTHVASSAGVRDFSITLDLVPGENKIPLTIRSESGKDRVYSITIFRGDPPPLNRGVDQDGDYLVGIQPGTLVKAIADNVYAEECETIIYNPAGNALGREDNVGTGCLVHVVYHSEVLYELPILVRGDLNGDGRINAIDTTMAIRYAFGVEDLQDAQKLAADTNRDGRINAIDTTMMIRHAFELDRIEQ